MIGIREARSARQSMATSRIESLRRLAIFTKLCSARAKKVAFVLRPDRNLIAATLRTITASTIVSTQDARQEYRPTVAGEAPCISVWIRDASLGFCFSC